MRDDFAVFILCHGRPDNVITWDTLDRNGYTGKRYIILDDEDKTIPQYIEKFGKEHCRIFSKSYYYDPKRFDSMDTFHYTKCAVFARNACFDIANQMGLNYFCELDDDMTDVAYRIHEWVDGKEELKRQRCHQLDKVFDALIKFLNTNRRMYAVSMGQPGDYIGGTNSFMAITGYKRKCMNFWVCSTSKPFQFRGTMNDDVNTYYGYGMRGFIFMSTVGIMTDQPSTQNVDGGMTDTYKLFNTYVKSFYPIMINPTGVHIAAFITKYPRIHHRIHVDHSYPCIISDRFKK